MIVRIAGEGQFDIHDELLNRLNVLDNRLVELVAAGDGGGFQAGLAELLATIRSGGKPLAADDLRPSEIVFPPADTTLEEARHQFAGEGMIPG